MNSFSANYIDKPANIVRVLYRLKKYQYLIYKHWLLHGLNISIAITGEAIACRIFFRLYWLSLNAAYVFEFFLQTLVRVCVSISRFAAAISAIWPRITYKQNSAAHHMTVVHVVIPYAALAFASGEEGPHEARDDAWAKPAPDGHNFNSGAVSYFICPNTCVSRLVDTQPGKPRP